MHHLIKRNLTLDYEKGNASEVFIFFPGAESQKTKFRSYNILA